MVSDVLQSNPQDVYSKIETIKSNRNNCKKGHHLFHFFLFLIFVPFFPSLTLGMASSINFTCIYKYPSSMDQPARAYSKIDDACVKSPIHKKVLKQLIYKFKELNSENAMDDSLHPVLT